MERYQRILFGIGLITLIVNLAAASEYEFGTKVMPGDSDISRPLLNMPAGTGFFFWDTGTPGYDLSDTVYLSTGPIVNANDVRLTPFCNYPAGSKVTSQDNDIAKPLLPVTKAAIAYLNLFGSAAYDLADPVYVRQFPGWTTTNDIRLNVTPGFGLMPGTKVHDFDPDMNKMTALIPPNLRFFDVNGNGVYDYYDDVYLNFPTGIPISVKPNNVRLSGPV